MRHGARRDFVKALGNGAERRRLEALRARRQERLDDGRLRGREE